MELVFGAGALQLAAQLERGSIASVDPSEEGKNEESTRISNSSTDDQNVSSTPLKPHSRGRTRLRNSGRSSNSSPSPVRPRLDSGLIDPGGGTGKQGKEGLGMSVDTGDDEMNVPPGDLARTQQD